MSENGSAATVIAQSIPFHQPRECPPCESPLGLNRTRERESYEPNQLSNSEAAILVDAARTATLIQEQAEGEVDAAIRRAVTSEVEAEHRVGVLEEFARAGRLATVHTGDQTVRARYAEDGPENRRHRPRWATPVLWLTIVLAAAYDTAFLANIFLQMIDEDWDWTSVLTYVALLPGVLIAVALLVTGSWVAETVARSRAHRERTSERTIRRPKRIQTRKRDDMPWPRWWLSLFALALVLGTTGMWAYIRAFTEGTSAAKIDLPAAPLVLLLILFSLTAVGMKVLHHNPYIDDTTFVQAELVATNEERRVLVDHTRVSVAEYRAAVESLKQLADRLAGRARRTMDEAWMTILRQRDNHGLTGEVAPKFVETAKEGRMFDEIQEPIVRMAVLTRIEEFLAEHDPARFRPRWETALARLRDSVPSQTQHDHIGAGGGA